MDEARLYYQGLSRNVVKMFGSECQEAYTKVQALQLAHDKLVVEHKMEGVLVR